MARSKQPEADKVIEVDAHPVGSVAAQAAAESRPLTIEEIEGMSADELSMIGISERAAVRRAKEAGEEPPPTPVNDWIASNGAVCDGSGVRSGNGTAPRKRGGPKATYTRNGKPLSATHDSLSYMAYACTKNLGGEGVARIGVKELKEILRKDHGIADPEHSTWAVELANGEKVGATMPSDQAAAKADEVKEVKKAERTTKKAAAATTEAPPTKKASGTKKAAPTKAAASKNGAAPRSTSGKRSSGPITKESQTRRASPAKKAGNTRKAASKR